MFIVISDWPHMQWLGPETSELKDNLFSDAINTTCSHQDPETRTPESSPIRGSSKHNQGRNLIQSTCNICWNPNLDALKIKQDSHHHFQAEGDNFRLLQVYEALYPTHMNNSSHKKWVVNTTSRTSSPSHLTHTKRPNPNQIITQPTPKLLCWQEEPNCLQVFQTPDLKQLLLPHLRASKHDQWLYFFSSTCTFDRNGWEASQIFSAQGKMDAECRIRVKEEKEKKKKETKTRNVSWNLPAGPRVVPSRMLWVDSQ